MAFTYKMVQVPPNIVVKKGEGSQAAAQYLEQVAGDMAKQGWEFYRVDSIGVAEQPGCLMGLLGQKTEWVQYYVMTFRRSA